MAREKTTYTFGDMLISKKGKNEFLEKVSILINFKKIEKLLKKVMPRETKVGTPEYSHILLLKILLLETWYNLSDMGVEEQLNDRLSFIKFLELSVDSKIPEHSTISRFRTKLLEKNLMGKILLEVNKQLEAHNLLVKEGIIVDATTVSSNRHPRKMVEIEEMSKDREEKEEVKISYSDDEEAKFLVKGNKIVYGYKCHVATDKAGFMLGGFVTGANESDVSNLSGVLERVDLEEGTDIYCDKGYSSKGNDELLKTKKLNNRIMKKGRRGKALKDSEKKYNKILGKTRYVIEQSFGILKKWYGFSRMRYIGQEKCELELYLKMLTFNIKKGVLKLTP